MVLISTLSDECGILITTLLPYTVYTTDHTLMISLVSTTTVARFTANRSCEHDVKHWFDILHNYRKKHPLKPLSSAQWIREILQPVCVFGYTSSNYSSTSNYSNKCQNQSVPSLKYMGLLVILSHIVTLSPAVPFRLYEGIPFQLSLFEGSTTGTMFDLRSLI